MEKDALLEILLHDLKEVETLVESFKGKPSLSKAFFKLARNRVNSILDELEMLEELVASPDSAPPANSTGSIKEPGLPDSATENLERKTNTMAGTGDEPPASDKQNDKPDTPGSGQAPAIESNNERETETSGSKEPLEASDPKKVTPSSAPPFKQTGNTPAEKQEEKTDSRKTGKANSDKRVLGEKLGTGQSSFNEHMGSKATNGPSKRFLTSPPVSDLKKALGINDRFFFQRELFGGNADVMNQTLEQLNEMNGMEDARDFLLANFNWDTENEAVSSFMELVERRYS